MHNRIALTRTAAVAAVALTLGAASFAAAQQPPQRDSTRAARDTAAGRAGARQTSRGEVVPPARTTRARVSKDQGVTARDSAMTTRPSPDSAMTPPPRPRSLTDTARVDSVRADSVRVDPAPAAAAAMTSPSPAAAPPEVLASLRSDANALALLHESNVGEIQAGTLAQRQARDSAVRAFAEMMVREHTALDQQGTALAQRLGLTPALPDSALPQLQASELAALPGSAGGAGVASDTTATAGASTFDATYLAQQVVAHARTLALVDAAIERATNTELRAALQTEVRPRVASHLDMARQLQQRVGTAGMR